MVDVEPYQYQKTTNVKEHNDIVAKINEIVDVINNANLDTVISKISELDTEIEGITENLVSDVSIIDGITTGKFKVRLDRKKAPSIDSNDYNLQKATSIELIQGSGPSMLKAQITLSDGTVLISDDFLFTTEAIGTDVYISSFVFKNGNVAGTISADIGLSNGTMLEANNFLIPTDPSIVSSITDLQNRVTNIENTSVTDSRIDAIENELNNKADITNVDQEITFKTATVKSAVQFDGATGGVPSSTEYGIVGGNGETHPFTITMKTEAFGQVVHKPIGELALLDGSGNPKNFTAGEVWEEVDLNNWPTDWVEGDKVKITTKIRCSSNGALLLSLWSSIIEFRLTDNISESTLLNVSNDGFYTMSIYRPSNLNTPSDTAFVFLRRPQGDLSKPQTLIIKVNEISSHAEYIKIWRLKK